MNIEHKCPKYKLDSWRMCYYKIHYDIDDCKNNCAIEQDKIYEKEEKEKRIILDNILTEC